MAYQMRFRVAVYLVDPQNNGDAAPVGEGTTLIDVGSYEPTNPTQVVIHSLAKGTAAAMSVNNRIQRSFLTNVRFEIFGKPVGAPEDGAPDLTQEQKEERRYIIGDTPNPALVIAIAKANRKPVDPNANPGGIQFNPADPIPEVNQVVGNP